MSTAFIINAHQAYSFSKGALSAELVRRISRHLTASGYNIIHSATAGAYDIEEEVHKHQIADLIIFQIPVNWFSVPWPMKKYMDEVYTAGLDGRLCANDGRTSDFPEDNYGSGGALTNTKYMLSLTYNAPRKAFDNKSEFLLKGKGIDDMFFHLHANNRFLGMSALPTFACYDVLKNPQIENDFDRLITHLDTHIIKGSNN